jgi:ionotropic glutamate receptor
MNDYKYHYLFTTFDMETFDLEDFKYNFVNMTAFRVVDVADLSVQEVLRDMARFQANINTVSPLNSSFIQVSPSRYFVASGFCRSSINTKVGLATFRMQH